ncbi:MAG TPA: ATP-binding cassette domain-containing protein [Jatrophihabitans sp.]|jgi:ABC-type cobalamin/Fe3+-siderophores transport system ATPase subunit|nr:ATP-binding cassette domain-containing protein [Jatrophihabitans sp.]
MAAVRATELTVIRGGNEILHQLTFEVASGQVTGVLGPSGCGKTTLIRAIAGTQRIARGGVEVLDRPAGRRPAPAH